VEVTRVETPLGPIEFHGRDTGRPVQLVITGAFASCNTLELNQDRFPELDVWRTHLPGNHSPPLVATSVGVFAAAISQALRQRLARRTASVIGISVGALVAMALDPELVDRLLLLDPPLRPDRAWPLLQLRGAMPPGGEDFVWQVFGIAADRTEPRDYSGLVERVRRPAKLLVGSVPLAPERHLPSWPSLVDEESRRLLAAHPLIDLEVMQGAGHHIPKEAWGQFESVMRAFSAGG
jgi:pimeloyl-ACP methyl ester carboxylesterase